MAQQHREEGGGREGRSGNGHREDQSRRYFAEQDESRQGTAYRQGEGMGRYPFGGYQDEQGGARRGEWQGQPEDFRSESQWSREPRAQGSRWGQEEYGRSGQGWVVARPVR